MRAEQADTLAPFIVYLIGVPAVGKYTVAREIARRTGASVIDNQLINIPVFHALGYDGTDAFPFPKAAWDHIGTIRRAVQTTVRELASRDRSFVFTNVLEDKDEDEELFEDIATIALERGSGFFPVWLTCSEAAIRSRKTNPDRRARLKDVDVSNVAHYVNDFRLLRVRHPHALELNTTTATAVDTAATIIEHVRARQVGAETPAATADDPTDPAPTDDVALFWRSYIDTLDNDHPHRYLPTPPAWSFGNTSEMADALGRLVLRGIKTATCCRYLGENLVPEAGPSIILDGRRRPICVVETTEITVRRFKDVDAAFARDEGEGDRSLDAWRTAHWQFFTEEGAREGYEVSPEMWLECERFRVLFQQEPFA